MPNELLYEIRRDGCTVCRSFLPRCGYPVRILKDMISAGFRYYAGGKLQRKVE